MSTEVENIVSSFRAVVAQEQLDHRTIDGAGTVASFIANVRAHQARYLAKLDNLRADDSRDANAAQVDAAEVQITKIADEAVNAAQATGHVEVA
jgi:hypothetical protein